MDPSGGNDANAGTTEATAWATLSRASQDTYVAGDSLLLKAGETHAGQFIAHGYGLFDKATYESTFATSHAAEKAAIVAGADHATLVANAVAAGQTAPQAAAWGDIWAAQMALPTAQDAAWTAADASAATKWIRIGKYGAGADPVLDGGGTVESGIYFARPSMAGWEISDLEFTGYTRAGISLANLTYSKIGTENPNELYLGAVDGLWVHDVAMTDIALAGLPADPPIDLAGYNRGFATGITVLGVNYVRIEDCSLEDTDLPFYVGSGQQHRFNNITSTSSWWQHAELAAAYRVSMTSCSFTNQCSLGYPHGSAGFFSSHMHQYLVSGCTFSGTTRPDPNGLGGAKTPDGVGYDLETRHKHAVFDQNTLTGNAGEAFLVLHSYAVGPISADSDANIWSRNVMDDNAADGSVSIARVALAQAQGTALWSGNTTTRISPAVGNSASLWIQSGQIINVIPGTGAGTPWIFGADNTVT